MAGLAGDQIGGDLWESNCVNQLTGVLEHPPGVSRAIEICEEDAMAHFRAWLEQKQSPEPTPAEPNEPHPPEDLAPVEAASTATPAALGATGHGVTPPGVDSKEQALEAWIRAWPKRVRKGPKKETYNDWVRRRLAAAKDASELQGVHITQQELRKVDRKIEQKPS